MALRSFGLKSVKLGDIPDDGSMSTVLVDAGLTYKDSASLKESDGTTTDVYTEEEDYPVEYFQDMGQSVFAWQTMDYTPEQLQLMKGGQVVNGVWMSPTGIVKIEKSVQFITKRDLLIEIPRANLHSLINMDLKKVSPALIDNKAIVLLPNKAGLSPLMVSTYQKPTVNAGSAASVAVDHVNLVGTSTPYRGTNASIAWTVDTKPALAADPVIATPNALNTAVTGLVNGIYKLKLTVTDSNGYTNSSLVTITVTLP